MHDETPAALTYAGPDSWHHLIAQTHTFPLTEATTQAAALSMDSVPGVSRGIKAIWALCDLAATSNILANAAANATSTANAREVFEDARSTARTLDILNERTPRFNPTFRTYQVFWDALQTKDPQVIAMLLVDTIRIANHIID